MRGVDLSKRENQMVIIEEIGRIEDDTDSSRTCWSERGIGFSNFGSVVGSNLQG